ncbi:hypothetical protein [Salinispora tropica]|uniref:Uncharacterized protein n=1 Tax=Salinispora tropica (strain ATCC BAA-916 / DSM 44818 / JCM 13857 / NBRC 105044 / CNB-440) TaxID=369723 RepID=A4X7J2_SALTO|nr:hypothetical protein [Salinispora tropica]ABP54842.1 hypothetical protein Strop_2395 [Salinispora tropica CNB-440]
MKHDFTRWLPAIAKTPHQWLSTEPNRKLVMSVTGVLAIGGLALAPTTAAASVTSGPHTGAVAAIELATGRQAADPDLEPEPAPEPDRTASTADADRAVEPTASDTEDTAPAPAGPPSREQLIPYGVQGAQSYIQVDNAQRANAKEIIEVAKATGVGERGAVIGVATALQESKLYNLGHLGSYNDHDSQGLFQQRPSTGWGTPEQITDPQYAATAFFEGLKNVNGWQQLPLTTAAQTVQVSAYPFHYAQWEEQAAELVAELW